MVDAATPGLTPTAKLALVLCLAFLVAGGLWHGVAFEDSKRLWRDLFERAGGPMSFRFLLQPVMAIVAATYAGVSDARANRTPYLRSLLTEPANRGARLSEGLVSIARIVLLGLAMDAIYQWKVLDTFYPGEAALIALALGFLPYIILRGPIARIARWWIRRHPSTGSHQGVQR